MSSAEKVRPTDSLLRYLNDSLQSGWAPVQTWPGSQHGEAPLQKAAQRGCLPGPHHRPAKLPDPGRASGSEVCRRGWEVHLCPGGRVGRGTECGGSRTLLELCQGMETEGPMVPNPPRCRQGADQKG